MSAPHRARVLSWQDLLDGRVFQAVCAACRWEGDVTNYEPAARIQAREHADVNQREGAGQ